MTLSLVQVIQKEKEAAEKAAKKEKIRLRKEV